MKLSKRWTLQSMVFAVLATVTLLLIVNFQLRQYAVVAAEEKAKLIIQQKQATINYVVHNLRPPLFTLIEDIDLPDSYFDPSWMSATYINRIITKYFKDSQFDEYYYKNAAINARSPENEADQYEREFIEQVTAHPETKSWSEIVELEGKPFYLYIQPQNQTFTVECLRCHSVPENAPADMVELYGPDRSFNKKVGAIPSVLSLRIPLEEVYVNSNKIILTLSVLVAGLLGTIFFVQWLLVKRAIINPIKKITAKSSAISNDESLLGDRIDVSGDEEIMDMSLAFSEMSQKLAYSRENLEELVDERTEDLLKARSQAQSYLDIAGVLFVVVNSKGEITLINQKGCDILGIAEEQALGLNWFDNFLPEGERESVKLLFESLMNGDVEAVRYNENSIVNCNGDERFVAFNNILLTDSDGTVTGVLFSGEDITERKQTEEALLKSTERFQVLFEKAPISYQSLDENGLLLEVNQTWLENLGYQKEEVIGKSFGDFLSPDWCVHFKENFPQFKSMGEVLGVEFEMVRKDGTSVLVAIDGKIGSHSDGSFKQTHCVLHDITQQRKSEVEQARLEEQLRQSHKMEAVGTMAGGIAHDFNNILAIILGNAELALEEIAENSLAKENIDEIIEASDRASNLVRQILAFSRKEKRELVPIFPQSLVKETLKLLRSTTPTTVSIIQEISQDCGAILADPTQLHQVVMNLFANAVYAMDEKGEISIRMDEVDIATIRFEQMALITPVVSNREGRFVQLSIVDSGTGLEQEAVERIFDPFFTTKGVGKGTGMGLSVVHGIVESHDGFITVESTLGKGSVFSVYFPVTTKEESTTVEVVSEHLTGSEQVLVVDDEDSVLAMAKRMLESLGYHVTAENNSLKALQLFAANPNAFDLLITDQSMPNMSGSELVIEVLKLKADMPIILCTGYSAKVSEENAAEQGISKLINKPYSKNVLSAAVREVLGEI